MSDAMRRVCAWLAVGLGTPALAAPDQPAADWLQVEVVVFQVVAPNTTENMQVDAAAPELSDAVVVPAFESRSVLAATAVDARREPVAYERLEARERKLGAAIERLERSGQYRVLVALDWWQPVAAPARAVRIDNRAPIDPSALVTEVPVPAPGASRVLGSVRVRPGTVTGVDTDVYFENGGNPMRLAETRRVRSGELHYLDHPYFGALVLVNEWLSPEAATVPAPTPAAAAPAPPTARPVQLPAGRPAAGSTTGGVPVFPGPNEAVERN